MLDANLELAARLIMTEHVDFYPTADVDTTQTTNRILST